MALQRSLGLISLLVRDYDEALAFYVGKLGFTLVEDTVIPDQGKRWVVIRPGEDNSGGNSGGRSSGANLLLAKAGSPEQAAHIGNQTGGRVFLFLYTDDFQRDYARFKDAGVVFLREPAVQPYGTVAVFADLYGNAWDLIEPNATHRSWP